MAEQVGGDGAETSGATQLSYSQTDARHAGDLAVLRKGIDPRKDQSYFLFSLRQEQLLRALTPLGRMAKSEIRSIARKLGLKVADKADSQEICFVPGQDYKTFLRSHLGENQFHRGGIYDLEGNFIAAHAEKLDERREPTPSGHARSNAMWSHDRVPETDQKTPR